MGVQNLVVNVTTGLIVPTARPDCAFLKCETPPGNQRAPRHHRRSEGVACVIYCLLSCLQASLTNSANFFRA